MFVKSKSLVDNNPEVSETVNPLNGQVVKYELGVGVDTTREPHCFCLFGGEVESRAGGGLLHDG